VVNGINWCVQNKAAYNIRVLNLSMGHLPREGYRTDPLCQAVESAVRAGIVVCVSAGNNGKDSSGQLVYGGISSPGVDPAVITVGASNTRATATRADDTICTFSSRAPRSRTTSASRTSRRPATRSSP